MESSKIYEIPVYVRLGGEIFKAVAWNEKGFVLNADEVKSSLNKLKGEHFIDFIFPFNGSHELILRNQKVKCRKISNYLICLFKNNSSERKTLLKRIIQEYKAGNIVYSKSLFMNYINSDEFNAFLINFNKKNKESKSLSFKALAVSLFLSIFVIVGMLTYYHSKNSETELTIRFNQPYKTKEELKSKTLQITLNKTRNIQNNTYKTKIADINT